MHVRSRCLAAAPARVGLGAAVPAQPCLCSSVMIPCCSDVVAVKVVRPRTVAWLLWGVVLVFAGMGLVAGYGFDTSQGWLLGAGVLVMLWGMQVVAMAVISLVRPYAATAPLRALCIMCDRPLYHR